MKKLLVWCLVFPLFSFGQLYPVSEIPDSLLQNADVVKRFEELTVIVKNPGKAVIKHKYVLTILNEKAKDAAVYSNQYDKLRSLSNVDGKLFDANGKELKSVKRRDIYDYSDADGDFASADRQKVFSFFHSTYPYTVEFEDEQVLNGIYHLHYWFPVENYNMAVQKSTFTVETPKGYVVRYKINKKEELLQTEKTDEKQVWEIKNFKALEREILSPSIMDVVPNIRIAPTDFEISGYKGNMNTWNDLGKFHVELNKGRNELPEKTKQEVKNVVANLATTEQKVNAVYNYMQQHTRYISIQLGIGGWQPLPANFVAEKKYGDCKALSNYMVSLLHEVGVKAHYVIIKSNERETEGLDENFPATFFNHIVCCVPNGKDSIWLECTSQTTSPGYMGSSTGNRKALLISNDGGVVVSTPRFTPETNLQLKRIKATVNDAGLITINCNTRYTGTRQELPHGLLNNATPEIRNRYYNNMYELPNFKIENVQSKEIKNRIPEIVETVEITAENYATVSGKRLFIAPNLFTKEDKLSVEKPRKNPIVYLQTYRDVDTIEIKIPDGYMLEAAPKDVEETNVFGTYKIKYTFENSTIRVFRFYQQRASNFAATDYPLLVAFYEKMAKADRAKMVFVKKEG